MLVTAKERACKTLSFSLVLFVGFKLYSKYFGRYNDNADHILLKNNKHVNFEEFVPKRSLFEIKQLTIHIFEDKLKLDNILEIEYLGSGVHFDAYAIYINNGNDYLLRIARYNNNKGKSIKELMFEFKFLPKLQQYLKSNDISIQIPVYDQSLSNIINPHKSYIYGVYPLIKGKRLALFDIDKRIQILDKNKDKLAKFLNALHSFKMDDNDISIKHKSSFQIFIHMIEELEWVYFEEAKIKLQSDKDDIELAQFIENDVISKCRNIVAPKWKNAYDKNDNEMLYGLIHSDFHLNHILCDKDNLDIVGVIDWSDVCLSHIPFQFSSIWSEDKKCFDEIVNKYIQSNALLSKNEQIKQRFLCFVDIYGFMSLLFGICWFKVYPGNEHLIPKYMKLFKNEMTNWNENISRLESV